MKHLFKIAVAIAYAATGSASLAQSNMQEAISYKIQIGAESALIHTSIGNKGTSSKKFAEFVTEEVNSDEHNGVQNIIGSRESGYETEVTPVEQFKDGSTLATVRFVVWDHGVQKSKGTHSVRLAPGKTIPLPAVSGDAPLAVTVSQLN